MHNHERSRGQNDAWLNCRRMLCSLWAHLKGTVVEVRNAMFPSVAIATLAIEIAIETMVT
jgi:hypothetical protein